MPYEFRVPEPSFLQKLRDQAAKDPRSPLPGRDNYQQQHYNFQRNTPARERRPDLFTTEQQPQVTGAWGAAAAPHIPGTSMSKNPFSPR